MLSKYPSVVSRSQFLYPALVATLVAVPFGVAFAARGTIAGAQGEAIDQSAVDPRIQTIAESEVQAAMARLRARSAAAVVMDPASGRVLAFAEGRSDSSRESWSTRMFTPASTVKPFVLAGAIETGAASEASTYDCRAPYVVAGETFSNWIDRIGSAVSATTTIAQSVNVCAIHIAQDTGARVTRDILGRFGLTPTWDDGVNEALQLARAAMGDMEPVTIAQLTKAFATLANGGRIPGSTSEAAVSQATAQAVGRTLVETVRNGTGRSAAIPEIQVAGKTGTSAVGDAEGKLAMFGGFVPADHPEYVAFVVVEDGLTPPGDRASGGQAAAPIFREIMRRSLSLLTKGK